MMVLESCTATQSWVNREYRRGWTAAYQEVQDPVAEGDVQSQGPALSDELGGHYGVECRAVVNEQHCNIGVPLIQMGEGSVECNRDCILYRSVGVVCKLEWVEGIWADGVCEPFLAFQSISWLQM